MRRARLLPVGGCAPSGEPVVASSGVGQGGRGAGGTQHRHPVIDTGAGRFRAALRGEARCEALGVCASDLAPAFAVEVLQHAVLADGQRREGPQGAHRGQDRGSSLQIDHPPPALKGQDDPRAPPVVGADGPADVGAEHVHAGEEPRCRGLDFDPVVAVVAHDGAANAHRPALVGVEHVQRPQAGGLGSTDGGPALAVVVEDHRHVDAAHGPGVGLRDDVDVEERLVGVYRLSVPNAAFAAQHVAVAVALVLHYLTHGPKQVAGSAVDPVERRSIGAGHLSPGRAVVVHDAVADGPDVVVGECHAVLEVPEVAQLGDPLTRVHR